MGPLSSLCGVSVESLQSLSRVSGNLCRVSKESSVESSQESRCQISMEPLSSLCGVSVESLQSLSGASGNICRVPKDDIVESLLNLCRAHKEFLQSL